MLINSISGRLLLLTIVFVMMTEVLVFVPSVARFREGYLRERLERAQIASLALLATPNDMVDEELEKELLANANVINIALRRDAVRELILSAKMPPPVDVTFDLRDVAVWELVGDALNCALAPGGRVIRVIGRPVQGAGDEIEITLHEGPLKSAMLDFGLRVLALSLVISLVTAALIFVSVRWFLVGPMRRVIENMQAFQRDPEDESRVITPASGIAEINAAERALAEMENTLRVSLKQQARLATLGEAVSKISHDLRNMLTTTQLLADRLEESQDPRVARIGPKLIASIDRAIRLCQSTLDFGRAEEPEPERRHVVLRRLVDDVGADVFPEETAAVRFINGTPEDLTIPADPEQLYRILSNLARNARQAIEAAGGVGDVRIGAEKADGEVRIWVSDTGPGMPTKALENIFKPFKGGARRGGSGLGLVIAAELARGHGGKLELTSSTTAGTEFMLRLPLSVKERSAA
jgi:signal transduction histidine kinase